MATVIADSRSSVVRTWIESGPGYVSGIAPGIVSINGSPSHARVEVRHRASRVVVDVVVSESDGTYGVYGVSPEAEFDVIGRDVSGTYNDVIVSRVRPEPYDVQSITGSFAANSGAGTLDGHLLVSGGMAPYEVDVVAGSAPPGITFDVIVGVPPTYAEVGRYVVAAGTTSAGSYTWTIKVTAANGSWKTIACSATFT